LFRIFIAIVMKITVGELRRIIKEVMSQETGMRWMASSGEPVDRDELGRLSSGGFLNVGELPDEDEDEDDKVKGE
jgi:hypothetical protein